MSDWTEKENPNTQILNTDTEMNTDSLGKKNGKEFHADTNHRKGRAALNPRRKLENEKQDQRLRKKFRMLRELVHKETIKNKCVSPNRASKYMK